MTFQYLISLTYLLSISIFLYHPSNPYPYILQHVYTQSSIGGGIISTPTTPAATTTPTTRSFSTVPIFTTPPSSLSASVSNTLPTSTSIIPTTRISSSSSSSSSTGTGISLSNSTSSSNSTNSTTTPTGII